MKKSHILFILIYSMATILKGIRRTVLSLKKLWRDKVGLLIFIHKGCAKPFKVKISPLLIILFFLFEGAIFLFPFIAGGSLGEIGHSISGGMMGGMGGSSSGSSGDQGSDDPGYGGGYDGGSDVVTPNHQCSLSGSPQTQRISNGARARVCYGNPRRWTAWAYTCSNGYVQSGSACVQRSNPVVSDTAVGTPPVTPLGVSSIQCISGDSEVEQITDGERTRTCRPNDGTWADWTYQCDSSFYEHHGICRFGAEPNFCPVLRVLPDRVPAEAGSVDSH